MAATCLWGAGGHACHRQRHSPAVTGQTIRSVAARSESSATDSDDAKHHHGAFPAVTRVPLTSLRKLAPVCIAESSACALEDAIA